MILPVVITYYIFNWLFNLAFRIINNTIIIKILKRLVDFGFGEKADTFYMQVSVYIAAFLIIFLSITMLGYMTKVVFSQNHKKSNRCIRKNSNYKNCILDI